ncbi:cystathionine beta-lyase [Usitatibacter palustris]|uniref:Cystathionine beta-lyase MetC n=1 Tax=Usitatibacter palustris TaxID=2732487 RepID=A0A6M4H6C2_9PROT|nr:cystathionine beta-lyase [Usitatibacter palustris]QJR13477.1 Cystathionine beta-lyase MetC [Usitatibacter palustris]
MKSKGLTTRTKLAHAGRSAKKSPGTVNLPVARASTVLFESLADLDDIQKRFDADEVVPTYGIANMPLRAAFEELMVEIEGGYRAVTLPSGLAANAVALLAALKTGDHVLMVDSVYGPARRVCDRTLKRYGIETTYYDPLIGAGIERLMKPNTKCVYLESPGSHTFEVQDFPAIAKVAHAHGAAVIHDNTWATGLFFKSFEHGADLVVQAATKYPGGHSDVLIGAVVANEKYWPSLRDVARDLGQNASPDDIFLALRGMRTMEVRLRTHQASGIEIATKLASHPKVKRVLHPALPSDPGHVLWKRDFTGAAGLFAIELVDTPREKVAAFVESLELFGLGFSWGGFESLVMPSNLRSIRTATPWKGGPLVRLQIGLEDPADLIADLERGLEKLG